MYNYIFIKNSYTTLFIFMLLPGVLSGATQDSRPAYQAVEPSLTFFLKDKIDFILVKFHLLFYSSLPRY